MEKEKKKADLLRCCRRRKRREMDGGADGVSSHGDGVPTRLHYPEKTEVGRRDAARVVLDTPTTAGRLGTAQEMKMENISNHV